MKRSTLLKVGMLCTLLAVIGLGAIAYAQDVLPTPENPLPDELVGIDYALKYLIQASPWYVVSAFIVFLLVALLRGKLKLGSWNIRIPAVSDWLDGKGSRFRFWAVIVLSGLGMGFYNLSKCTAWTAKEVIVTFVLGIPSGITLALAAMGLDKAKEVHVDPNHTPDGKPTYVDIDPATGTPVKPA